MSLAAPPPLPPRGRSVTAKERAALLAEVAPIDLDLVVSLPSLPLRARYLVESFLTGCHRSPIKGTAPEFAEYATYQPGDELRRIDWRLYGRSDRLCVKKFEDENQLRACLALDLSASLRYASRLGLLTKLDLARTVLAATALLARRQHDAVGLALLGDTDSPADGGIVDFLQPGASVAHQHTVFGRLESTPVARSLALGAALPRLAALLPRGGLVVLASDFYCDLAELKMALRLFRSQRLELLAIQVLDPMELELGADAAGRFVDLEDGTYLPINTAAVRAGYMKRFDAFQQDLHELFREHGADLVSLRTDGNPLPALAAYLARRARLA
ncbi:MAG: DUF58 domain-containing protein [Opitutaceae bacterium]